MHTRYIKHSIWLIAAFFIMSCKKQELMVYQQESNIYFSQIPDTVALSFAKDTITRDTLDIDIAGMGMITKEARRFMLVVNDSGTTAKAGRDYILPHDSLMNIPGGTASRTLPLIILRSPELKEQSVTILLKLQANDQFQTMMTVRDSKASRVVSVLQRRIVVDDILPEPSWWKDVRRFLGAFSRKKAELFAASISQELPYATFVGNGNYYPGILRDGAIAFQQYLNGEEKKGKTIYETDGTPMKMGPDAQ